MAGGAGAGAAAGHGHVPVPVPVQVAVAVAGGESGPCEEGLGAHGTQQVDDVLQATRGGGVAWGGVEM